MMVRQIVIQRGCRYAKLQNLMLEIQFYWKSEYKNLNIHSRSVQILPLVLYKRKEQYIKKTASQKGK